MSENLTNEARSKGGKARAKKLSKAQRSEAAKRAAEARWGNVRRAEHEGVIKIPNTDIEFECAVLDDETRVISERAFSRAIGAKRGGSHWTRRKDDPAGANLPVFLSAKNLRPYIDMELASALSEPIGYNMKAGGRANGIEASRITDILDVWLKARADGKLTVRQERFATVAEILVRALAKTGVVALVDEATGFQDVRPKDALAKLIQRYVAEELKKWVKTFPTEYFKGLCRLRGVAFREDMKFPPYFGHLTNDIIYSRLAPGVLEELRAKNPRDDKTGRRKNKHFQWLSEDFGHPKLILHLGKVVMLMEMCDDGDYEGFQRLLDSKMGRYREAPLFKELIDADSRY